MERASVTPNYLVSRQVVSNQIGEKADAKPSNMDLQGDQCELQSDMEILKTIRSVLHAHAFIDENNIIINIDAGWVYLEGKVPTEEQRNLAVKLIVDIFGVTRVTNYLTFPRTVFHSN